MPRHILFISKSVDSASTRYRALQFFPLLAGAGFTSEHITAAGSPLAYLRTLRRARAADIVVVLRKTFPAPYLWLIRQAARRLVFDFDDAIFCNSDGSASTTRMGRFAAMIRASDHVLAGNAFLARQAAHFNRAVDVLPTCVDAARYAGDHAKTASFIDLVWIGSRSTRKYLVAALPALRMAANRIPNLRLKIIADFDLPDAGLKILAVPWNADREARELGSAHIGIAPMSDNDWTRGKCALKVLQYMASGLPVVSSDAGANGEIVTDGETGFLVGDDASWAERICMLAGNPEMRDRMGMAGRQRVTADYSIEPVFSRMLGLLEALS
jgi:glycosyltransferase involved in cell wall biosynthesis